MSETAHYDEACKEALDLYFEAILRFFFPAAHQEIDWTRPLEFKDTEFQSLLPAAEIGQRSADKLAQAFLLNGQPTLILIHVEVQSQKDTDFARRMFVYHYRIYDKYQCPVMSLAILGDDNRGWRPQTFGYEALLKIV